MFFFLVKEGADVSYLKPGKGSALSQAAFKGYKTMIQILISHGVDVKAAGQEAVLNAIRKELVEGGEGKGA
jgi:hypothetical protein